MTKHPLLDYIEKQMELDQGKAYKEQLRIAMSEIEDAFNPDNGYREHLGASSIVNECKRKAWYDFRWTKKKNLESRLIRLFNRGHLEEARFVALLRSVGLPVWIVNENDKDDDHPNGRQYGFKDGLYRGSCDGITILNNEYWMLEMKTHNDSSFSALQAKGVRGAKQEHYDQMQILMYRLGLKWCLYMAVNKNNDELYFENVSLHDEVGKLYDDYAFELIYTETPPPMVDVSPSFWKCKWCDHYQLCKFNDTSEIDTNCRTCKNGTFGGDQATALKDLEQICLAGFPICMAGDHCGYYERKVIL